MFNLPAHDSFSEELKVIISNGKINHNNNISWLECF